MYAIDLPARLILLPGLGADHRLFTPQKRVFRDTLDTPDLIAPTSLNESLRSYAQRWAPQLRNEPGDSRPLIIGGVSLGGIIAMEMAQAVGARAVVLIASCRNDRAVPLRARVVEAMGRPVPASLTAKMLGLMSLPFALINEVDDDGFAILRAMATDADPSIVKWGGGAMSDWESQGDCPVPVHQVHGGKDKIIPPQPEADLLIGDGGHLINLTHAQAVNQFLVETAEHYAGTAAKPVLSA